MLLTPLAVLGILCGTWLIPWPYSIAVSLCCLIAFVIPLNAQWKQCILLAGITFVFAIRIQISDHLIANNHYLNYNWSEIKTYRGIIDEAFYRQNGSNRYILNLQEIACKDTIYTVSGKLILYSERLFEYGDCLEFSKEWRRPSGKRNPGQFDYNEYLNRHDIYALVYLNRNDSVSLLAEEKGNPFYQYLIEPSRRYIRRIINR